MANQLDEMNPEIMSEGRDVHVIAKVIPVETSGFEKTSSNNPYGSWCYRYRFRHSYRQVSSIYYWRHCIDLSMVAIKTN